MPWLPGLALSCRRRPPALLTLAVTTVGRECLVWLRFATAASATRHCSPSPLRLTVTSDCRRLPRALLPPAVADAARCCPCQPLSAAVAAAAAWRPLWRVPRLSTRCRCRPALLRAEVGGGGRGGLLWCPARDGGADGGGTPPLATPPPYPRTTAPRLGCRVGVGHPPLPAGQPGAVWLCGPRRCRHRREALGCRWRWWRRRRL